MRRLFAAAFVIAALVAWPHGTTFHSSGAFKAQVVGASPATWQSLQWALKAADVPQAWNFTTGAGTTFCSVDTGVTPSADLVVSDGINTLNPGASWVDDTGHGTHVAGIAVGKGHEIQGVAPDAKLIVAKVLGSDGSGTDESVTAGIAWCIEHHADVVNMSLGGDSEGYDGMAPLIRYGCQHGVDFAVAAGNDGKVEPYAVPANIHSACLVDVEASQHDGHLAAFSNWGENPRSVVAPGTNILSLWLNGGVAMASGTSMASPMVAGTLLLLRSEGMSAKDAVKWLLAYSHPHYIPGTTIRDSRWGHGSLDVAQTVNLSHE